MGYRRLNSLPYRDVIRFKDDAKAKYMYDSFWSPKRIREF